MILLRLIENVSKKMTMKMIRMIKPSQSNISLALVILILAVTNGCAMNDAMTDQEGTILAIALQRSHQDGGFSVVSSDTDVSELGAGNPAKIDQCKNFVLKELQTTDVDVVSLVDTFFDRNKKAIHLSLKSSPQDGYIIDKNRKFEKYFKKDGGGWEKWRKENPKAHSSIAVSVPVYEEKSGLVMVYIGEQLDLTIGWGYVLIFKYEKGKLTYLKKVEMWRS